MKQPVDRREPFFSAFSLAKTAATGLIVVAIVSFVAMFFLLKKAEPTDGRDLVGYYVPWCVAYGVPSLACAITGIIYLTRDTKKPFHVFIYSIVCYVFVALAIGASIPFIAIWGNVEFFVSALVIALCEGALATLALVCYVQKK